MRDPPLHRILGVRNAGSAMWIAFAPSSTLPAAIAHGTMQVTKLPGFIEKHGLWTDEQRRQAEEVKRRVEKDNLQLVRLAWADPHGASRAKAVTPPAFAAALENGHNINVATSTLDSANARTFASFMRGGGIGLDEMTGSPNLIVVPDPATFRVLPWAPGVGWILCDEYFNSGVPFHFSPRQLLRRQLRRFADKGVPHRRPRDRVVPAARRAGSTDRREHRCPRRARAPDRHLAGRARLFLSFRIQPGFDAAGALGARRAFEKIGLPLRSIENEWGPGQVECTFAPRPALEAADHAVLFRTATRQICRRMGYFATFMCRPALKGFYSSGWHLHQSLVDGNSGRNRFMPEREGECLSPLGHAFLGGLLKHAAPARRLRHRRSTATDDIGRTRSRPTAPPGATTIAA